MPAERGHQLFGHEVPQVDNPARTAADAATWQFQNPAAWARRRASPECCSASSPGGRSGSGGHNAPCQLAILVIRAERQVHHTYAALPELVQHLFLTVAGETPSTAAVSAIVSPPK